MQIPGRLGSVDGAFELRKRSLPQQRSVAFGPGFHAHPMHEGKLYSDPTPARPVMNKPEHTRKMLEDKWEPQPTPFDDIDLSPKLVEFTTVYPTLAAAFKATDWAICRRYLGAGNWGQVYLGFRLSEEKKPLDDRHLCAVKQSYLRKEDAPVRDMMKHESQASPIPIRYWKTPDTTTTEVILLRCLHHENVVRFLKEFAVDETKSFYILLEYCDGGDLDHEQNMMPGRRFRVPVARYYFKQVMAGVTYIHSKGIAHRDIKLPNVLLQINPDGQGKTAKVADFGLSSIAYRKRSDGMYDILTSRGVRGTPPYFAPELLAVLFYSQMDRVRQTYTPYPISPHDQATGRQFLVEPTPEKRRPIYWLPMYEERHYRPQPADVYACGVLLYKMITGYFPYDHRYWPRTGLDLVFRRQPMTFFTRMDMKTFQLINWMLEPLIQSQGKLTFRPTAKEVLEQGWMKAESASSGAVPTQLDQLQTLFVPPHGLYDLPSKDPPTVLLDPVDIDKAADDMLRLAVTQAEVRALESRPKARPGPGRGREPPSRSRSSSQPGRGGRERSDSATLGLPSPHRPRSTSPGSGPGHQPKPEMPQSRTRHDH